MWLNYDHCADHVCLVFPALILVEQCNVGILLLRSSEVVPNLDDRHVLYVLFPNQKPCYTAVYALLGHILSNVTASRRGAKKLIVDVFRASRLTDNWNNYQQQQNKVSAGETKVS